MKSKPKILLTNDDGIDAAGLHALSDELKRNFDSVVIAPDEEHSECGHCVTTKRALVISEHGNNRFSINGTPADCVRLGLELFGDDIAWVIAGINHGGNLGADIWMSGTVAAAREAYLRGSPAIAVSQVRHRSITDDWRQSARLASVAIEQVINWHQSKRELWNINLPALSSPEVPPIVQCELDSNPLPLCFVKSEEGFHYRGDYHGRPRSKNSDVDHCFQGRISISLLGVDSC